jgi:amino acid transporter
LNTIAVIAFFVVVATVFLNLYLLLTRSPPATLSQAMKRWQASIIVFACCLIFYIIFYTTVLNGIENQTTWYENDGSVALTAANNDYVYELGYLRIALGLTGLNLLLTLAMMIMEFRFFGRAKFKPKAWSSKY